MAVHLTASQMWWREAFDVWLCVVKLRLWRWMECHIAEPSCVYFWPTAFQMWRMTTCFLLFSDSHLENSWNTVRHQSKNDYWTGQSTEYHKDLLKCLVHLSSLVNRAVMMKPCVIPFCFINLIIGKPRRSILLYLSETVVWTRQCQALFIVWTWDLLSKRR